MARTSLRERLAADPDAAIEAVAAEAGVSVRAVIEALPEGTRHFGDGGFFADAMKAISRWGDVPVAVHTADGVVEIAGPVPEGRLPGGAFNLSSRLGVHGHIRPERCGGIAFVERPSMGKASAFVAFLDVDGGIMFKVLVGRDAAGALQPEQLKAFRALREAVVAEHIDDD
ncbi:MAG: heme utilization cystosolic carrier protein HutX [Bauldia sp.]|jgi:putative heme utilization carrier protein HutX|nr:heme utilization cystosolic carrier protein HutX [Bauldia sp.]